jgi:hypothetical protein
MRCEHRSDCSHQIRCIGADCLCHNITWRVRYTQLNIRNVHHTTREYARHTKQGAHIFTINIILFEPWLTVIRLLSVPSGYCQNHTLLLSHHRNYSGRFDALRLAAL